MTRPASLSCTRSTSALRIVRCAFLIASFLAAAIPAHADLGKWSPAVDWSGGDTLKYAVHLALLPGDGNPSHSRVVFWNNERDGVFHGGQWGWRPGYDGCTSFPSSAFTSLGIGLSGMDPFCSGHALLDGKLFVASGHNPITGWYGENKARIFTPGLCSDQGSWSDPGLMAEWRWYASVTALRGSRQLVTSGQQHRQHRILFGRRNGADPVAPTADTLYRMAPIPNGKWDDSVLPAPDPQLGTRPAPRYGHTVAPMEEVVNIKAQVLFGGRPSEAGLPFQDTWLLRRDINDAGPDFAYSWERKFPTGGPPARRVDHSAVVALGNMTVIYGGLDLSGQPLSDAWRLFYDSSIGNLRWSQMIISAPSGAPAARFAHGAVYDEMNASTSRMIVFGGSAVSGQALNDQDVWELRFDSANPNNATWLPMTRSSDDAGNPAPSARYWHSLTMDPTKRARLVSGQTRNGHVAYLFGGSEGGTSYSGELWALWLYDDNTYAWQQRFYGGSPAPPSARARHSMTLDVEQSSGRLYLYGGETAGSDGQYFYALDLWVASPQWTRWYDAGFRLSGHSAVPDAFRGIARRADVYTPGTGFTVHPSAALYQQVYPPTFLVPGGGTASRVFTFGSNNEAYWLDIPATGQAGPWNKITGASPGFNALTGVQYRTDRVLICGGRDANGVITGLTSRFNVSSMSGTWTPVDSMAPRLHHHLVALPNGKVLVVGGNLWMMGPPENPNIYQRRPQIWDPATDQWSDTTGSNSLAEQPRVRGHHSAAILLPDGRVLTAGGERDFPDPAATDRYLADVFCPPYLFRSDGVTPAARPVISSAPAALGWGATFHVYTSDPNSITNVCLIRPGATTHSVNQNQRYVPLTFVKQPAQGRLEVTAPPGSDHAPPGYYMLFVTGSVDGPEVPSVANWVRLGNAAGDMPMDAVLPGTLSSFTPDFVSQTSIYFVWQETSDDDTLSATGAMRAFDLRRSGSAISNEAAWASSYQYCGEPAPLGPERWNNQLASGLSACTWYHFALRGRDEDLNLSGFHGDVYVKTLCGGGGGGGLAARKTSREGEGNGVTIHEPADAVADTRLAAAGTGPTRGAVATAALGSPALAAAVIVVETERVPDGSWRVRVIGATEAERQVDPGDAIVEQREGAAWRERGRIDASQVEDALGLCALRERSRTMLPRGFAIGSVAGSFRHEAAGYALAGADHSALGALEASALLAGGTPNVAAGDTLTLRYAPSAGEASELDHWYVLASRTATAPAPAHARPKLAAEGPPARFALHQNQPNPFRGTTTMRFDLPVGQSARLEIFDGQGRKLRTLADRYFPAGAHTLAWDQSDEGGTQVTPGIYFYRIEAGPFRARRKLVVLP